MFDPDQLGHKSIFAKQRGPMERGLTEQATEVRLGSDG
jgi:hypothetical protein